MSALLELAERVEQTTGPDRGLDAAISRVCPPINQSRHITVRAYTASLDAAMTLVPEGWWGTLPINMEGGTVFLRSDTMRPVHGKGCTEALALCAAALRAAMEQSK